MLDIAFRFILFVAGSEPNSLLARKNLDELCNEVCPGKFEMEIIDILEDAGPALEHGVVVTPSLLVTGPEIRIMIAGNLSNRAKVRTILQLPSQESA